VIAHHPPTSSLTAVVAYAESMRRPNRLVIIDDPDHGTLAIWWHLDRRRMWRCPIHGTQATTACPHTTAAAHALAHTILGLEQEGPTPMTHPPRKNSASGGPDPRASQAYLSPSVSRHAKAAVPAGLRGLRGHDPAPESPSADLSRDSKDERQTRAEAPRRLQPCGTWAAYKRHRKAGEVPCDACKEASALRSRGRYKRMGNGEGRGRPRKYPERAEGGGRRPRAAEDPSCD
jgi:hypothetical protein